MSNLLKMLVFSLLMIGFFAGYSNFGIPQIQPSPPPEPEVLDLDTMTMSQFVSIGERVFEGRGTCALCHNAVGGRAPLLDNMNEVTPTRLLDVSYQGSATDVETYLRESMTDPSAYVVSGFGKAGSNDTESPMTDVSAGSIGLTETEIDAVIAYLQDLAGAEISVQLPALQEPESAVDSKENPAENQAVVYASAEEIIVALNCGACHKIADQQGMVGPDLTGIGAAKDVAYLRRAILDPNADVAAGGIAGIMPANYGDQLSANELEMLLAYMVGLKAE